MKVNDFTDPVPGHPCPEVDQQKPLIVIMEELQPLTKDLQAQYGEMSKEIKSVELADDLLGSNRPNLKKSYAKNFKRFFAKKTLKRNQKLCSQIDERINQELSQICQSHEVDGPSEYGEDKNLSFDVSCEVFNKIHAFQGHYCADGTPKNVDDFWKKVCKVCKVKHNSPDARVNRQALFQVAKSMYSALKLKDLSFYIFEVPKQFPTGFFMQPVTQTKSTNINSACYADDEVRSLTKELDHEIMQSEKSQDYSKVHRVIEKALFCDVTGGIGQYTRIFFAQDGYQQMDQQKND